MSSRLVAAVHVPMLSNPAEVAKLIMEAAKALTN
jgi:hypothetical protein